MLYHADDRTDAQDRRPEKRMFVSKWLYQRVNRRSFDRRVFAAFGVLVAALGALGASSDALAAKSARFRHGLVPSAVYDLVSHMEVKIEADMGALDVTITATF